MKQKWVRLKAMLLVSLTIGAVTPAQAGWCDWLCQTHGVSTAVTCKQVVFAAAFFVGSNSTGSGLALGFGAIGGINAADACDDLGVWAYLACMRGCEREEKPKLEIVYYTDWNGLSGYRTNYEFVGDINAVGYFRFTESTWDFGGGGELIEIY